MPIISEDNIIQIKMKMLIWIIGIIIAAIGSLGTWKQIQINSLKGDLSKEKVKIYVIETEDMPELLMYLSSQQSQLNTLNTVVFGKPNEMLIGNGNIPTLPGRGN